MDSAAIGAFLDGVRTQLTAPGSRFEVVEEDVRGNRMEVFRHRARSVREVLDASATWADRTYIVDGDVRLSYAEHLELVDAFAVVLQDDFGVQARDRVSIFAANRWEWAVAFWAVISLGAVPAAFNGWWTADEVSHAVDLVEPVLVLGDAPRLVRVTEAAPDIATFDLARLGPTAIPLIGRRPTVPGVIEDDPAVLLFTSGTTGRPKAVTVPHRSVVGFLQLNLFIEAMGAVALGGPVPGLDQPTAVDEVVLITAPLFHTSMLQGYLIQAATKGGSIVLVRGRFDPERVLKTIEQERVTMWSALGSAAPRVCSSPAAGRYDTSSIRRLGVGGAPVSPAVQQRLLEVFPSAEALGIGYASTESGAVVASFGGPEFIAHPTSTGRVAVTSLVELRDPEGNPVPEGESGEIHVRSPYVMLGYWRNPDASAAVVKEGGWLAMGDIGRIEDGLLYIDSRAREMILVSAENVSPTEVEFCLEEHPDVVEAAVFAVDDDLTGDAVCAVVHPRTGTSVTEHDLAAWVGRRLARYKVPTRWYLVDEPLPRTASGKLVKRDLRQRVEADGDN